jgi:hypothetical protein
MNLLLGAVLVVQLVLASTLIWSEQDFAAAPAKGPLVAFDKDGIDTIVIAADKDTSVTLSKGDDGWEVPARADFPASHGKVDKILTTLAGMKPRLPVATSDDARKRFHVADDSFQRRLSLKKGGDTVATVYFGDSAGPDRVFARLSGKDAIYEVNFGVREAKTDPVFWLDTEYLARSLKDIKRIDMPDVSIVRDGDSWKVASVPDGKTTDVRKASAVVSRVSTLRFDDVLGHSGDVKMPDATYRVSVTTKDGDKVTYAFAPEKAGAGKADAAKKGEKQGPDWLMTASGSDYVFRVGADTVKRLREYGPDKLVKAADKKAGGKDATAGKPKAGSDSSS